MRPPQRIFWWCAVLLWMAFIFYLSSIPDLKSPLPNVWDFLARKLAHMLEFGILYLLAWRAERGRLHRTRTAIVIAVFYAVTDEAHQAFVAGRVMSVVDMLIDSVGIIAAMAILKRSPTLGTK